MQDVSTADSSEKSSSVVRQRKAHRKVKTGCTACKIRRQKCDEQKPLCAGCSRHSTNCVYEDPERVHRRRQRCPNVQFTKLAMRSPISTDPKYPSIPPSPPALNLDDLELLHHYMTSTSFVTAQLPGARLQAQVVVPQIAQTHPFVMRLILAKAATHLSWLVPNKKTHYSILAGRHHRAALPEFRAALENISEENYRAVILYAKGLVWCAFAWFEPFSNQLRVEPALDSWLPNWFHLLRGSCMIVEACKAWIPGGTYIIPPPLDDLTEFLKGSDSEHILALGSRISIITESPIRERVMVILHEAFARASMKHHNTPLRNAMNFWAGAIPNEYLEALQREEAWALIIMAHFSILVSRSEVKFYMKGHGKALLTSIYDRLPPSWRPLIQFPCQEVGVEVGGVDTHDLNPDLEKELYGNGVV